jgi:hypothetical protein
MNVPGYVPGFLQPIENRILMTSTGIRAQVGVKIFGDDLAALQRKAFEVERVINQVQGATGVAPSRADSAPPRDKTAKQQRAAHDLTRGDKKDGTPEWNLGPTGARGWIFSRGFDTSESRQILVESVAQGSPADGVLAPGDVILGAGARMLRHCPHATGASDTRRARSERAARYCTVQQPFLLLL